MNHYSSENILRIWERGQYQHPLERVLTILTQNNKCLTRKQVSALPIVQRDDGLLDVREQLFGTDMQAFAQCPQCGQEIEFSLTTTHIRSLLKPVVKPGSLTVAIDDVKVQYRFPDSEDLTKTVECGDIATARSLIAKRCICKVTRKGTVVRREKFPAKIIDQVAKKIAEHLQQAEVSVELQCPVCGSKWHVFFDIANFLWKEISVMAKRLLSEVHALASTYGWGEGEILSLSPQRRKYYLEAVT